MKTLKIFLVIPPLLFLTDIINAQVTETTFTDAGLYSAKSIELHSFTVNDDYKILVSTPEGYDGTTISYPVIYVLDGDIAFGMMTSIARYLQVGNNIPEAIIVGIGYGALNKDEGNKRTRDYSPAQDKSAEKFLKFIREELIPFVDKSFRTKTEDRTINGYSLAGTFALYTLFTYPDTFNRYIVGSPYLPAGNYAINNYEEKATDDFSELKVRLFISVGSEQSEEKYFDPIDEMVSRIQSRNYAGLSLETKVFEGGTHLICPPETIAYGLISVFKK